MAVGGGQQLFRLPPSTLVISHRRWWTLYAGKRAYRGMSAWFSCDYVAAHTRPTARADLRVDIRAAEQQLPNRIGTSSKRPRSSIAQAWVGVIVSETRRRPGPSHKHCAAIA